MTEQTLRAARVEEAITNFAWAHSDMGQRVAYALRQMTPTQRTEGIDLNDTDQAKACRAAYAELKATIAALNEPPASQKSAAPIAQEPPEPGVCAMCGHAFSIPDGLEPTEVCNTCAQEFYATHAAPQVAQEPVAWRIVIAAGIGYSDTLPYPEAAANGWEPLYAAPIAAQDGEKKK